LAWLSTTETLSQILAWLLRRCLILPKRRCRKSFKLLKQRLTTAPVLATPRDGGNYLEHCDTSDSGLGAVLQQCQDGQMRVAAYTSRTLAPAKKLYCTTRKKQFAMQYSESLKKNWSDECRCADHKVTTRMKSDANTTE